MSKRTDTTLLALLLGGAAGFLLWALTRPEPPPTASSPQTGEDDLTRIKGIGPTIQRRLNEVGIHTFRRIADWSDADVERIGKKISFPHRIEREDWRGQAQEILNDEE